MKRFTENKFLSNRCSLCHLPRSFVPARPEISAVVMAARRVAVRLSVAVSRLRQALYREIRRRSVLLHFSDRYV